MNELTVQLEQYFQDLEIKNTFSGVVLITQGEKHLFSGAYGYASRSWNINNSLNIRFDTASITKVFTAVATLQMIDLGMFNFRTGVIEFLGLKDTTISKEVNVYHLLTHTSGIGDDVEEEDGELYEELWKEKPNYSVVETADFLPQFIHKPANFAAGEGCRYCNCSFILLGLMIEKCTGMAYRDYIREQIFDRCGMKDSDFLRQDLVNERTAEGSDPLVDEAGNIHGWKRNIYSYPSVGSPDGGAYLTAGDLDRFIYALKDGLLLSSDLTSAVLTPQVTYRIKDNWTMKYGYGLWFYVDNTESVVCYQKEGINAGVSGLFRHFPKQNINVVILSNMMDGVWEPVWKIHEKIVDGQFDL